MLILGCRMHVQGMKTLLNDRDRNEVLDRLQKVRPDSQRRWGSMSAHQMICHLSDSFRAALGKKQISSSSTLFKRTIYKWAALWVPLTWPHGIKTRPEVDQQQGGTRPVNFHRMLRTFALCLNSSAAGRVNSHLTPCSVSCRGLSGCGMPTVTWITT